MHSLILSTICMIGTRFLKALSESFIGRIFMKIYNAISKSFSGSFIVNLFTRPERSKKSCISIILRFPFYILEFISSKIGDHIHAFYEKSIFLSLADCYFNAFAALNTRFLGLILAGASLALLPSSLMAIVLTVLGVIMIFFNINLTDFLGGSFFVNLAKSVTGFKNLEFNIYDLSYNRKSANILALITGILSGVAFMVSPILILLPIGIFALFCVLKYPIVGVFAALFAAPLIPTMLLAGICLLSFGALVLHKLSDKNYRYKTGGVGTALILLLLFLFIASVLSFNPQKSLMVWAMYMVFFSFYFVIINTVETKEQLFGLLRVFVISGFIVGFYGVIQYVFKLDTTNLWIDEEMFEEAKMRAYSTLENPNVLGEYLLLLIPLSAVFMLKDKIKSLSKYVFAGIFLTLCLCMVFTQSRGCWLGLILSVAVFIAFYEGRLFALAPVAIMLVPFILPEAMMHRLLSIGNMEDTSTSYRVYIWFGTYAMLKTYWLGGIGMGEGAFQKVYPFYSYSGITAPHSHNLFLQLMVEGGIMTLLVFVAAILMFVGDMSKIYRKTEKHSYENILCLALGSGVLGFMLQSMFDYTFYNYRVMSIFIMYLSLGAVLKFVLKESRDEKNT